MGGKKHKKKVFTTPKVIHNKHINSPLASLKFYEINSENNLVSKKCCPMPECGQGIFMASHSDRYYCGKCHFTIIKDITNS
jgi:small subunit ribosomal protein S27Ae